MLGPLLITLAATVAIRPFEEERQLLERRLETIRRALPDGADPARDATYVREVAQAAKLGGAQTLARPPVESGPRGDVIVDLSATARFGDVERFFRQPALGARLVDVESLTLSAAPDGLVRLDAVLRLPFRPSGAALPEPPEGIRVKFPGIARPQAEAFAKDQLLALVKSEQIVALRRGRRNPRLFLCELAAISRDRPVTFTFASLSDEFVVRGLAIGEGTTRALERRFESGYFRVLDFLMARHGACRRFEVRGRSPIVGQEAELPLPTEDPFGQDDLSCRIDRDEGRGAQVKAGKPTATGPISVRLRDVDLADLFQVLHHVSGLGFVVDGDVAGRVNVEMTKVSVDEALSAVAKATGLFIQDAGALRRVSRTRNPPIAPSVDGPSANFELKRTDIRELLALMAEMDPSLASLGPPGSLGRLSVFVHDKPLGEIRSVVLAAAGLTERVEESRRLLETPNSSAEASTAVSAALPERRLAPRAESLAILEFELAGVASAGDRWVAYAHAPTGMLCVYPRGARLADGTVRSVEANEVWLDTDAGALRVPLGAGSR